MQEDRIKIGDLSPGDVALLKDVAEAAAEKAVQKCLVAVGINPHDPIKTQEEFSIMRYVGDKVQTPEFKEDLAWLRSTRLRSQGVFGKAILTAVAIAVAGGINAFVQGLKALLQMPPG